MGQRMSCLEVNRLSTLNDFPNGNGNKSFLESEITEFIGNAGVSSKVKKVEKGEIINFSSIVNGTNSDFMGLSPQRSIEQNRLSGNRIFSSNATRNSTNLMDKISVSKKSPMRTPENKKVKVLRTYSPFTKTSIESE